MLDEICSFSPGVSVCSAEQRGIKTGLGRAPGAPRSCQHPSILCTFISSAVLALKETGFPWPFGSAVSVIKGFFMLALFFPLFRLKFVLRLQYVWSCMKVFFFFFLTQVWAWHQEWLFFPNSRKLIMH